MGVEFTAHNIRLDDGTFTKPDESHSMEAHPWLVSARRILESVFPGDKQHLRLADLGCLEGGYAVEFARMGFQVVGVDVRESNLAACEYVKSKTDLPNLQFVKDNVLNIQKYGKFDAIFCCGLLYHLDRPKQFLEAVSAVTSKIAILQTHFATDSRSSRFMSMVPTLARKAVARVTRLRPDKFYLSRVSENEGLRGRWFAEFTSQKAFAKRETSKWASWDNHQSFWVQREYLLQAIQDVGFDLVMEQFDGLGENIADSMLRGFYRTDRRGTFIGIKTQNATAHAAKA